jgi:methyl-accepting chemotaxis protein
MNIWKRMKISQRLALGFTLALGIAVMISATSVWKMDRIGEDINAMMDDPLATERLVSDWSRNISRSVARTTAVAKSSDPSLSSYFTADAAADSKSTSEIIKKVEVLATTDEEKALLGKITDVRKSYVTHRDAVFKLKAEGKADEAEKTLEEQYIPASKQYQQIVADLLSFQRKQLDEQASHAIELERSGKRQILILTALVMLLGIVMAWWLTVSITKPLDYAVHVARKVADGDLTTDIVIDSKDETGLLLMALKDMNASLQRIVSEVRHGTHNILVASQEIATGNLDLSSRTEQQASSLEETAASMEEMTSTVRQNVESAQQANQLVASAASVAEKGGTVIADVVNTMGGINASANQIVDIIAVIDGIAFQTNILALNAAVEAARAGEQGRGFAVVASEVRTLAQRSAAAAKEIKGLIDTSVERVNTGSRLVNEAGETMQEIMDSVGRVTQIMTEISSASVEQNSGIQQINQAISQMDSVTQQNASLVEQAAAASQSMQDQAQALSRSVSVFKL